MALNKIFIKRGFLNYLIFSGILFINIINANKSIALTQENIDIPKVVSYRSASCCLLYTSPSPRDPVSSRMPSSA